MRLCGTSGFNFVTRSERNVIFRSNQNVKMAFTSLDETPHGSNNFNIFLIQTYLSLAIPQLDNCINIWKLYVCVRVEYCIGIYEKCSREWTAYLLNISFFFFTFSAITQTRFDAQLYNIISASDIPQFSTNEPCDSSNGCWSSCSSD